MSADPMLGDSGDRTHRVYWGSHGCCLPYRHTGPCVCDCALLNVAMAGPYGPPVVLIDTSDWWTPRAGEVSGDDVYGPPAPEGARDAYREWWTANDGKLDWKTAP